MKKLFIILSIALLCGLVAKANAAFTLNTTRATSSDNISVVSYDYGSIGIFKIPEDTPPLWGGGSSNGGADCQWYYNPHTYFCETPIGAYSIDSLFTTIAGGHLGSGTGHIKLLDGNYAIINSDNWGSSNSCFGMTLADCKTQIGGSYNEIDITINSTPPTPPTPTSTAVAGIINIPAATASSFLAQVSAQLADVGLLTIAIVAVAIPLAFYIIKQLMALVPKARGRRQ
jgi:hypothetical protein